MAMPAEWWSFGDASATKRRARSVFRHSASDAWLVAVTLAQACVTLIAFGLVAPASSVGAGVSALIFGVGVCWCSNTVSHNHLHNALFRSRWLNRGFDLWLSLLLGVPQSIWKARHLWHHAGEPTRPRRRLSRRALIEIGIVGVSWLVFLGVAPELFLFGYAPGYLLGMGLARLQGDMEHARTERPEAGVSHYGRLYNFFWFNDGYHAEHHLSPRAHWTRVSALRGQITLASSAFPPHLRFLERATPSELKGLFLCALERIALGSSLLQRFMLWTHARAMAPLLGGLPELPKRVAIVGGGLFPRSLLVLAKLLPQARFVVVDRSAASVSHAIDHLKRRRFPLGRVRFCIESFDPSRHSVCDLVVTPLGFVGDDATLLEAARATPVLRHDWLWARPTGCSRIVSWLLLKRMTLSRGRA
jgi:hypothetical protein